MEGINEKIKAVVFGHAVADALGVPVEFCSRRQLSENPVTDMRGYGTYPYPAGTWSDDTSMALATLDSLANGKIDFNDIMSRFAKWYYENEYTPSGVTFDIGGICRFAIDNYAKRNLPADKCGVNSEYSNGNGSLMRIYPFVFAFLMGDNLPMGFEELIDAASALTHSHERSRLGCRIYSTVLHFLIEAPSKHSVKLALDSCLERYCGSEELIHYKRTLSPKELCDLRERDIKSTGYVVDTLEAALWCLLTTDSYSECVLKAVNLGEDTDTVAAVAGSLAGALYGYTAIPTDWLSALKRREYIEDICNRFSRAWGN